MRGVRRRGAGRGRLGTGVLNGVAEQFRRIEGKLHCEDVPADHLVARWGTPLYVYSRAALLARYREFAGAFAPADPLIAYSAKANGNLSILRLLAGEGAGADIVSGGELQRALLAGIPPERIVFSGVGKTVIEMAAALEAGIFGFNVESQGELRSLADLGTTVGTPAPVALRVNPDIESPTPHHYTRTGHRASKFGIPTDDALALYRWAARHPGLDVRGISVHIGSQILEVAPYRAALDHVLAAVEALSAEGIDLAYLDLGGGFGVAYGDEPGARAEDFAAELLPPLQGTGLKLVLEPGRYVVGAAGLLLTRVIYVKEMGGKTFVVTDAGMNDLLRPSHYAGFHEVEPAESAPGRESRRVDVVGPICETGDFLALDRELEVPREGELLAIRTAGAYGFSMASTYNARPRPAEVMVSGGGMALIRKRETYDDLVRGEIELLSESGLPAFERAGRSGADEGPAHLPTQG